VLKHQHIFKVTPTHLSHNFWRVPPPVSPSFWPCVCFMIVSVICPVGVFLIISVCRPVSVFLVITVALPASSHAGYYQAYPPIRPSKGVVQFPATFCRFIPWTARTDVVVWDWAHGRPLPLSLPTPCDPLHVTLLLLHVTLLLLVWPRCRCPLHVTLLLLVRTLQACELGCARGLVHTRCCCMRTIYTPCFYFSSGHMVSALSRLLSR